MRTKQLLALATLTTALVASSEAALFLNDDFATFNSGDLVGQNNWVLQGTPTALPLQISGGKVVIPAGQTTDNQDAAKSFGSPFVAPSTGSASLFVGLQLSLSSAPANNSSYFLALYDGSFYDFRLVAKDSGSGGFLLGARVNGQAGYPFGVGTVGLSYGTMHTVVLQAELVSGNANDNVRIYVDPTSSDLSAVTPYATSTYSSGTVADPAQLTSVVISQFASATSTNVAALIGKVVAGDTYAEVYAVVPEPSSLALFGAGAVVIAFLRRRAK